jgi:hypothetical protein
LRHEHGARQADARGTPRHHRHPLLERTHGEGP